MATMAEQTTRRITETEVAYKRSKTLRATERAREEEAQRAHNRGRWDHRTLCLNGLSFKMYCCILYGAFHLTQPFLHRSFYRLWLGQKKRNGRRKAL